LSISPWCDARTGRPQAGQNRASAGSSEPHDSQRATSAKPQAWQKLADGGLFSPHSTHAAMGGSLGFSFSPA
jgi:hypothetical protein